MTRTATRRRAKLAVVPGSLAPDVPAEAAPEAPALYVIRNHGLGTGTRLLLLDGDPHAPFGERRAVATFECSYGSAPAEEIDALADAVRELLAAHGQLRWERECQVERWMARSHLELLP